VIKLFFTIYTIIKYLVILGAIIGIFYALKSIREKSKLNKLKNEVKKEIEEEVYREAKEVLRVKLKKEMLDKITEEKSKKGFNSEKFKEFFGANSVFKNSDEKLNMMLGNKKFGNSSYAKVDIIKGNRIIKEKEKENDINDRLNKMLYGKI
jgi:hypothetical protein